MALIYESLASMDFRRCQRTQFKQYERLVGVAQKVGVELECNLFSKLENKTRQALLDSGFKFSWERDGSTKIELTYLFDVSNPIALKKEVEFVFKTLIQYNIPTLGGVHINVQIPKEILMQIPSRSSVQSDIEGDSTKYCRVEYKWGRGFLSAQELWWQLIYFTLWTYQPNSGYNWDKTHLSRFISKVRASSQYMNEIVAYGEYRY